jgi:hypothetical protein
MDDVSRVNLTHLKLASIIIIYLPPTSCHFNTSTGGGVRTAIGVQQGIVSPGKFLST